LTRSEPSYHIHLRLIGKRREDATASEEGGKQIAGWWISINKLEPAIRVELMTY
jgi:hypothetical protein